MTTFTHNLIKKLFLINMTIFSNKLIYLRKKQKQSHKKKAKSLTYKIVYQSIFMIREV